MVIPNLVTRFLCNIFLILQCLWIKLNRRFQTCIEGKETKRNKCIIVGDSLALGIGDFNIIGSVAGISLPLMSLLSSDPSIRTKWQVVNCGEYHRSHTTNDWLPVGVNYRATFGAGMVGCDTKVVFILAGLSDLGDLQGDGAMSSYRHKSAFNIATLATSLQERGKRVCVFDIPLPCLSLSKTEQVKMINEQLEHLIAVSNRQLRGRKESLSTSPEKPKTESTFTMKHPIRLVSTYTNTLSQPEMKAFDGLHFNTKGYRTLCYEMFCKKDLKNLFIEVEWEELKSKMN